MRRQLDLDPIDSIELDDFVGVDRLDQPAEGIERLLEEESEPGERAFELIADHFGASLVRARP